MDEYEPISTSKKFDTLELKKKKEAGDKVKGVLKQLTFDPKINSNPILNQNPDNPTWISDENTTHNQRSLSMLGSLPHKSMIQYCSNSNDCGINCI